MKQLFLIAALAVTGFMSAKTTDVVNVNQLNEDVEGDIFVENSTLDVKIQKKVYKITLKTVCGKTATTFFDDEFDSAGCLYDEWEMKNKELCGRYSWEPTMV